MTQYDPNVIDFDATSVEPSESLAPIPAGNYEVIVSEARMQQLKSGNGAGLSLTYQVVSGEYRNRKLWQTLNIRHSSPKASEIAKKDLSALCRAVGVMKPHLCSDLCNRPLIVTVRIREQAGYPPVNEIKGYAQRPAPAIPPAPPAAASKPATADAPAGGKPSWMGA